MRNTARLAVVALVATMLSGPARSQVAFDSTRVQALDDTRAQRLFGTLMSPYCPGLTIATCPSPGADSLRRDIRERLARGDAPRTIVDWYVAAWGEQVLGAPPARRLGLVLWVIPGLALLLGVVGLVLWLKALRRRSVEAGGVSDELGGQEVPVEPAMMARLEAELREFGKEV